MLDYDETKMLFEKRLYRKFPQEAIDILYEQRIFDFYVAGGYLLKDANDIDLFPVDEVFNTNHNRLGTRIISETRNAITFKVEKYVVQLCNYSSNSLEELVKSFDFAHCQIGAKINIHNGVFGVMSTYFTEDFLRSMVTQNSFYTGSKYPLSSLMRLFKYKERGWFIGNSYIVQAIKICTDIIKRGYIDYEDFKDQLDAIDLGLLPEEIAEIEENTEFLMELFYLLGKKGEKE